MNINQRNKWEKNMVAEHQRKLRHDENVLSGSESDDEGSDLDVIIARSPSKGPESSSSARRPVFRTSVGVEICGLTAKEYLEVERLTIAETGPTEEQLIENAGRGCATMAMPALGGARRLNPRNIQHNSPPVVCVMAGNNRTGAIGIATARHLANHDCRVILMIVGGDEELSLANVRFRILYPYYSSFSYSLYYPSRLSLSSGNASFRLEESSSPLFHKCRTAPNQWI